MDDARHCLRWNCAGLGNFSFLSRHDAMHVPQDDHQFVAHWICQHLSKLPGNTAVAQVLVNHLRPETVEAMCLDLKGILDKRTGKVSPRGTVRPIAQLSNTILPPSDTQTVVALNAEETRETLGRMARPPPLDTSARPASLSLGSPLTMNINEGSRADELPTIDDSEAEVHVPSISILKSSLADSDSGPGSPSTPPGAGQPRTPDSPGTPTSVRFASTVLEAPSLTPASPELSMRRSTSVVSLGKYSRGPLGRVLSADRKQHLRQSGDLIEKKNVPGLSTLSPASQEQWLHAVRETVADILPSISPKKKNAETAKLVAIKEGDREVMALRMEAGKLEVLYGDIEKLISKLADENHPDTVYIDTFLLTYRGFLTPRELLERLIARFNLVLPDAPTIGQVNYYNKWREAVQLRCVNVIKKWIESSFFDLYDEVMLDGLEMFLQMMEEHESAAFHGLVKKLRQAIDQKVAEAEVTPVDVCSPHAVPFEGYHEERSVANMDAGVAAANLTSVASDLFMAIKPQEFLLQLEAQPDEIATVVPNLTAAIARFNTVSYWAATEVCVVPVLKKRAAVVKRLIDICDRLIDLQNFQTTMAIVSALNMSCVARLKKTWDLVPNKSKNLLRKMEKIMSSSNNYKLYRAAVAAAEPPAVPFLGLPLKDLTFFNDGNATMVAPGKVNFEKMRRLASTVFDTTRFQLARYTLAKDDHVIANLTSVIAMSDDELHKLSLSCEPSTRRGLFGRRKSDSGT